jgi:hypothetical protein
MVGGSRAVLCGAALFFGLYGGCWLPWQLLWGMDGGMGERVYNKKPHQVKLFFPIFYFLGRNLRIRNFFSEVPIIPEAFYSVSPNISLRIS